MPIEQGASPRPALCLPRPRRAARRVVARPWFWGDMPDIMPLRVDLIHPILLYRMKHNISFFATNPLAIQK